MNTEANSLRPTRNTEISDIRSVHYDEEWARYDPSETVRTRYRNTSSSKSIETGTGIDNEKNTLANVEKRELIGRSIMCTGPIPTGVGERSSGAAFAGIADGMPDDQAAQRPRSACVSCAPPVNAPQPLAAGSSNHRVAGFDGETDLDDEENAPDGTAVEQRGNDINPEQSGRIDQAQLLLKLLAKRRVKRGDPPPNERTLAQYNKWCLRIDGWKDPSADLKSRVGHYAANERTFNLVKAALKHRCAKYIQISLDEHAAGLARGDRKRCAEMEAQLDAILFDYYKLVKLNRPQALAISQTKPRAKKGKLVHLRYMPEDWRQQFLKLNEASETYRIAGALMCFSGLRPEELSKGIKIAVQQETIKITIAGAKVTIRSGQPDRSFEVRKAVLPRWLLQELTENPKEVYTAPKDAMRAHFTRLSREITGRRKMPSGKYPNLSAYCFRHAVVTDLRESGWDDAQIAGVIGDRCADTVRRNYGEFVHRGGGRPKKVSTVLKDSVQVTHTVKPPSKNAQTFNEFKSTQANKNNSSVKQLKGRSG